jgi:hypothetical protein
MPAAAPASIEGSARALRERRRPHFAFHALGHSGVPLRDLSTDPEQLDIAYALARSARPQRQPRIRRRARLRRGRPAQSHSSAAGSCGWLALRRRSSSERDVLLAICETKSAAGARPFFSGATRIPALVLAPRAALGRRLGRVAAARPTRSSPWTSTSVVASPRLQKSGRDAGAAVAGCCLHGPRLRQADKSALEPRRSPTRRVEWTLITSFRYAVGVRRSRTSGGQRISPLLSGRSDGARRRPRRAGRARRSRRGRRAGGRVAWWLIRTRSPTVSIASARCELTMCSGL